MSEYWGDVLQSFQNGVQLDLRVRLAIEFLKSPAFSGDGASPEGAATRALTLADSLLEQAQASGLLKPLPEDSELNAPLRRHLERNARAQIFANLAAQRIGSEPAVALNSVPATIVQR